MSMFPELHYLIASIDDSIGYQREEIEVVGVGMGVAGMRGDTSGDAWQLPESQVVVMYKFRSTNRAVVVSIESYREAMKG